MCQSKPAHLASAAAVLLGTTIGAQGPPPELNLYVLIDAGPVSVPVACPGIGTPFAVPVALAGWGFGAGPGAPSESAAASAAARRRQAEQDGEDRASLPRNAEDGLQGNAHAAISVAHQFAWGTAVAKNDREATRWYQLAAEQGHPDAARLLGYRYLHGKGVDASDTAAAYWYHTAAKQGDHASMVALGLLYAAGRGVPQDWKAAVGWWERAAPALPIARRFVGDAAVCGLGGAPDVERAVREYRAAADAQELSAGVQLARLYLSGLAHGSDEDALRAVRPGAEQGNPEAQIALSDLYRQGRGVEPSAQQAYMWARFAELRLPPGPLREEAAARAAAAARGMSAADMKQVDAFVEAVISQNKSDVRSLK